VIIPYTAEVGVPAAAGLLFMSAAAGMLTGDVAVARLFGPARRERLTPWLPTLLGVPPLLFLLRPGVAVAAAPLAVATVGFAYHLGLARRFVDAVPDHLRGQACGLVTTGMMTMQGVAATAAGALAEILAPGLVIAAAGAASLLLTATLAGHMRAPGPAAGAGPPAGPGGATWRRRDGSRDARAA
jgi:hypothetical protein